MVIAASLFLFLPLTLLAVVMNTAAAIQLRHAERRGKQVIGIVRGVLIALWLAACVCAIAARIPHRDWTRLFWSAQIPLLGIFFGSGALLCSTWRADAWNEGDDAASESSVRPRRWFMSGAVLFFVMTVTLGLAPLALQLVLPENRPSLRETGAPIGALVDLAAWGFGGELPATLGPSTPDEIERGVGHLPRDITVAMGMLLTAAWLWISFALIAIGGRSLRSLRVRRSVYLVAPVLLAIASEFAQAFLPPTTWTIFDPRFFGPGSSLASGIWTSDPAVLRSFGPVLLVAAACAIVLALSLLRERLRTAPATVPRNSSAASRMLA